MRLKTAVLTFKFQNLNRASKEKKARKQNGKNIFCIFALLFFFLRKIRPLCV